MYLAVIILAPEVICRQNHSFVSDYFALGVIAYELMTGKVIFYVNIRDHIMENLVMR